jgi:hypothetical protein
MKIPVASFHCGGDWGKPSIEIHGDQWTVDEYHFEWQEGSAGVDIMVRIFSEPSLMTPFEEVYSVQVPKQQDTVKIHKTGDLPSFTAATTA